MAKKKSLKAVSRNKKRRKKPQVPIRKRKAHHDLGTPGKSLFIPAPKEVERSEFASSMNVIILDMFSHADIVEWKQYAGKLSNYFWIYFNSLENQRKPIKENIRAAVLKHAKQESIPTMIRMVTTLYADHPLSGKGSLNTPGGRFNFPEIEDTEFKSFPAIYVAQDPRTAFYEKFGADPNGFIEGKPEADFIFNNLADLASFSITGDVQNVLDITDDDFLREFVDVIKHIEFPVSVLFEANELGLTVPTTVKTVANLKAILEEKDWRIFPSVHDIPASCQLFGKMCRDAGVQAIKFRSAKTGEICYAIFPENFKDSSSWIVLNKPNDGIAHQRLDSGSYQNFSE